jgi:predicted Zn-dependent protease
MQETGYLGPKLLLFYLVIVFNIFSQEYPDKKIHSLIISGSENLLMQDYHSAKSDFKKLNSIAPELPFGDIYFAAAEITEAYDYGIDFKTNLIDSLLETAEKKANILLEKEPDLFWHKYFKGLANGYSAYFNALNENWVAAFSDGLLSLKMFEELSNLYPENYDTFIIPGAFRYWKSDKLSTFAWLPFYNDERSEGIEYLKKAADSAVYNNYMASYSLLWIYINMHSYYDAVKIAEKILIKYPQNRLFKLGLARALEEIDKERSIIIYSSVLNSYARLSSEQEIILKHKIAQQYFSLGKREECLKLCEEILSKSMKNSMIKEKLKERLERVEDLYAKLR